MSGHRDTGRRLALALMVASGFAGLGYQIVWTQQSALWLGHESAAVLAVVAAFFGGLAVGSLVLGKRIDRSPRPAFWYAACEVAIALWGLALAVLLAPLTGWLVNLIGVEPSPWWHWSVVFCGTFLILLPATAPMGATMPAMERVLAPLRTRGAPLAALYAANTFGAVLGVGICAFWLVPAIGLMLTSGVCAALNLFCAAAAIKLMGQQPTVTRSPAEGGQAPIVMMSLAVTGLLGIGYEVLVVRVLSQVAENTVYTFAILLGLYLIGTSIGAFAYDRYLAGARAPLQLRDRMLAMLAAACLLGVVSLTGANTVKAAVLHALGASMLSALAAEVVIGVAAFLLPTIIMGALFSHLAAQAQAMHVSFGRALGVNTLGAASAPLLFGVLLVPAIGTKFALLCVAAGYIALTSLRAWRTPVQWATMVAAIVICVWTPSLVIVDVPAGGRIVSHAEGVMATVSVVEDATGNARLHINNRQQEGSSNTLLADARQALLPILLHPAPRRALFLGLGTGVTAWSAAEDPGLKVDVVELLPEVIEASAYFTRIFGQGDRSPRPHVTAADARRYVRTTPERYDVIVSDNFHPARSGSGSLYTVEHFQAVHDRLATGGIFCQWLPLHQLDLDTLRTIVRSFLRVYPDGWAVLATNSLDTPVLGLVARPDNGRFDVALVRARLAGIALPRAPAAFGFTDELALLGSFMAGPKALARFAGNAPFNTDDLPVVAYSAPRVTYAPDSLPRDRLIKLLHELDIAVDELIARPHDAVWTSRLSAYWTARDRFIEAGRDVRPSADPRLMLAQVREPLLAVLRISPDFRPAYDPLLRMATALGQVDPLAARALLEALERAQPLRPEAARALHDLYGK